MVATSMITGKDTQGRNVMVAPCVITGEYTQERSLTVATNMITGNTHTGEKHYGCNQRDYM